MPVELGKFLGQKFFKGANAEPCHCSLQNVFDLKGDLPVKV
jgi:hypothetical protein